MLCQRCNDNEATVHMTKIVNGEKNEIFLCEKCAQETGQIPFVGNEPFSFQNLLTGILGTSTGTYEGYRNEICESCGQNYKDFSQTGLFGCAGCYETFSNKLDPLLKRIHGINRHNGKVPKRTGGTLRTKKEIEELRKKLQQAIESENFEKAAELRDQIRELEDIIGGE